MTKEQWTCVCDQCGDLGYSDTEAEAVHAAEHHIIGDENPRPYRYHVVIRPYRYHVVTIEHTIRWESN